ncbi:MAG: UDP-2,3-diacylglucosamine hydrolase [Proteobacteria bacterium]|nr:UDP-2,3-diacylglucosamine hydrolase [Pseudomonadota bacterium]
MSASRFRSVFLSDIHLGTRGCQAERLLDFLRSHESEYLFLIGDIVDFWAMARGIHWTRAQNTVVQKILRRARHGETVIFVPGNHDEALRERCWATSATTCWSGSMRGCPGCGAASAYPATGRSPAMPNAR